MLVIVICCKIIRFLSDAPPNEGTIIPYLTIFLRFTEGKVVLPACNCENDDSCLRLISQGVTGWRYTPWGDVGMLFEWFVICFFFF